MTLSDDIQATAEFLSRYRWTGGYLNPLAIANLIADLNRLSADAHELEVRARQYIPAELPPNVVRLIPRSAA